MLTHSHLTYSLIHHPHLRRDPVETMMSQEVGVVQRLSSPIVSTSVDTTSVSFQRSEVKYLSLGP